MAKLVYGLTQSLDGYVDHLKLGPPGPALAEGSARRGDRRCRTKVGRKPDRHRPD
jgi:hypothetical protein